MNRQVLIAALGALLVTSAGCGDAGEEIGSRGAEVEILVYSGRENPRFELSDREADALGSMIGSASAGPAGRPPGLGYGGFVVRNPAGRAGLPAVVEVFEGIRVDPARADGARELLDDVGVEAWLAARARERGHGPLLDTLGR